jgi:acyl-CoA dehydrogenase
VPRAVCPLPPLPSGRGPGPVIISPDVLSPLILDADSPSPGAAAYLADPTFARTADFFKAKGLAALKEEDRKEQWYQDWVEYQAAQGIYAGLLSPQAYSTRGHRLSLLRLTRFVETIAYFSPAHGYSLQVSFLGLFPILMSGNEALKREAVARLEAGGLFAFAASEREHGSDLLANEFTVTAAPAGGYAAAGTKFYIGNTNAAGVVTVLGRKLPAGATAVTKRAPFVLFALRPADAAEGAYQTRKIRTLGVRAAYVGAVRVAGHPVAEADVIAEGRDAWEAVFGTVNLGKFFLGFGAAGICEHAFAESYGYLRRRVLYGKPASAQPHLRDALSHAYARLAGMKLYAGRALDYLQAASDADRRYLLFNAVQKARVSTAGVKVVLALSECVGARGFESESFLESALREAPMIPGLEGSTHINFGLTAQFLDNYFAGPPAAAPPPASVSLGHAPDEENPYWTAARDRNPKTVHFAPYADAYRPLLGVPNVSAFAAQAEAFRLFAAPGLTALGPSGDVGLQVALGKCFSEVAYGQLVAENCALAGVPAPLISLIFHGLVEDLSAEALRLASLFPEGSEARKWLREVIALPRTTAEELAAVAGLIEERYGVN